MGVCLLKNNGLPDAGRDIALGTGRGIAKIVDCRDAPIWSDNGAGITYVRAGSVISDDVLGAP